MVWNGLIGNYIPNVPEANQAIANYYGVGGSSDSSSGTPTWGQALTGAAPEARTWGLALVACLVLAVGVEEVPKVAVPLTVLIVMVMLLSWKGMPS